MQEEIKFVARPAVIFGKGEVDSIGNIVKNRRADKALIITDKGILDTGMVDRIINSLLENQINYRIFDEIKTNPLKAMINKGLDITDRFSPDIIIAVGGGSVIDMAKAIALYYCNPDLELLYEQGELKGNYNKFPVITIPTTAGTGSEVTSWAVITDPDIPEKVSIGGACVAPLLAIIDPEMTLTLPPELTLWTGMDAFIHALEAYLSNCSNEYVDKIAYLAMEYIINNLPLVAKDGLNLPGREKLLLASYLAGWAMENAGLGLVHGMSHQVGAFYHYHHGLLNAILLPYVVEYNYKECKEKMDNINKIFNNANGNKKLTENIFAYYNKLGLNRKISINKTDISLMSEMAIENVNSRTNPRKPVLEDVKKIYSHAFVVR